MESWSSNQYQNIQVVKLFDTESKRDQKYKMLQKVCEWSSSHGGETEDEDFVCFYISKDNWAKISKNPKMCFWLLESA